MNGNERREQILKILKTQNAPISGTELAKRFSLSRQVIVQDIAILRANGAQIESIHSGYILKKENGFTRVFKVHHTDEQVEDELNIIVDLGARVEDVFVYHKVYGVVKAPMNLKSRKDVRQYMNDINSGKSALLKNITSNYHYHTVCADDIETLEQIQETLWEKGFLAKLQEYEPLDLTNQ